MPDEDYEPYWIEGRPANQMAREKDASASPGGSTADETVERLRGQLQNCVNHLELLKRYAHRGVEGKLDSCIESANRALYETLSR